MIPVLKTERLVLRGFTWADFPAFADMWQSKLVAKNIPFAPLPRDITWSRMNLNTYRWVKYGFGSFAVADHDGEFLGTVSFFRAGRGLGSDFDAAIECGWVFAEQAHGRGIASEAVQRGHEWLDAQPFGGCNVCMMDAGHAASIRVGEKAGYTKLRVDEDEYGPVQLMVRQA